MIGIMSVNDLACNKYLSDLSYFYTYMTTETRVWYTFYIREFIKNNHSVLNEELDNVLSTHKYVFKGFDEIMGPDEFLREEKLEAIKFDIQMGW